MIRALWRLHLLLVLEKHVEGHPYRIDGTGAWLTFFNRLTFWENEEMLAIAMFICRTMMYLEEKSVSPWPHHTLINMAFQKRSAHRVEISFFQGLWTHLVDLCYTKNPPPDLLTPEISSIWPDSIAASHPGSGWKHLGQPAWEQAKAGYSFEANVHNTLALMRNTGVKRSGGGFFV